MLQEIPGLFRGVVVTKHCLERIDDGNVWNVWNVNDLVEAKKQDKPPT
jgi:hypothetical protein